MDRHIVMFLALLLFGSSVLASGAKADKKKDRTKPKWGHWNVNAFYWFDRKISKKIESAYQKYEFLSGPEVSKRLNVDFSSMIFTQSEKQRALVGRKGLLVSSTGSATVVFRPQRAFEWGTSKLGAIS
eukprot:673886_1